MKDSAPNTVRAWFLQPASYLALIATGISVATFFLVYASPGNLRIILPDRVGVALTQGDISVVIPLTFTNTGAPRTVRHVQRVTASLIEIAPLNEQPTEVHARWRFEYAYGKKEGAAFAEDKLNYVNRAIPFALFGGTSKQKVFELVQVERGFDKKTVAGFTLRVHAATESETISSDLIRYECQQLGLLDRNYQYCSSALP